VLSLLRVQSVFELTDGTALFVTVAKYLSPALHEIDRIGLAPDVACAIPSFTDEPVEGGGGGTGGAGARLDPRVKTAMPRQQDAALPEGLLQSDAPRMAAKISPLGPLPSFVASRPLTLQDELQSDACIIAAERQLEVKEPQL